MSTTNLKANPGKNTVLVSVDDLQVGAICRTPIEDEVGRLLLGTGTRITPEVIEGLRERGIQDLAIKADEAENLRSGNKGGGGKPKPKPVRPKERHHTNGQDHTKWRKGVPLKDALVNRHHEPIDVSRRKVLKGHVQLARTRFEEIRLALTEQKMQTVEALSDLSGAFASAMVDDHDQTVGDVVAADTEMSLTDRSVKLGVLGMAIGTELGLDGPSVLEIGMAGLLHDIGLYTMDAALSVPGRPPLSQEETWEYRKHPVVSANSLREVSDIPHSVLLAIEQVHEQFNGTGYPFGLEGNRIHQYARILNVCDTYLRLTIGTSFRKALVPHDALGFILHQARYGIFDPKVIHAFLRTKSLFPLGSRVELANGKWADVIRRPIEGYACPVLQSSDGERVDLLETPNEVVAPACDPQRNQGRLSIEAMQRIRWNPADELFFEEA
ncbi:HD domain-containing protein [Rhodopirellula sp. JC740]|uniref:HD domain-containing protein n=1 Tax=Rhodopirellula halodulae TaxID=2894198 RepID=A0ABS8NE06_9BACT|nr:HD domain-containing phosphohydrolase [Rhodopirellula sp. JC740]MCC9641792.1 HD domain-containing protein [Rhodopirellula sp. JC740]